MQWYSEKRYTETRGAGGSRTLVLIASNKPNKMLYSSYITNICRYKEISPFIPYFMYKQIIYKSFVSSKYF